MWGLATEAELQLDKDIEWFRPDPRRRLLPVWIKGGLAMALGFSLCGYGFLRLNQGEEAGPLAALGVGLILIMLGMGGVVFFTVRVLSDETCVGLRVDGLLRRTRGGEILVVPWAAIDEIQAEGDQIRVVTDLEAVGSLLLPTTHLDLDASTLAQRLAETRRKALMGLL